MFLNHMFLPLAPLRLGMPLEFLLLLTRTLRRDLILCPLRFVLLSPFLLALALAPVLRLRLLLRLLLLVNGFHQLLRLLALGPGPGLNPVRALVNLSLHPLFPVPVLLQRLLVLPLVLALVRVNLRPLFLLFLVLVVQPVLRLQLPLYLPHLLRAMIMPRLLDVALRLKLEHVRMGLRLPRFFRAGLCLHALGASRASFQGRHRFRFGMRGIRRRPLVHLHRESLALII